MTTTPPAAKVADAIPELPPLPKSQADGDRTTDYHGRMFEYTVEQTTAYATEAVRAALASRSPVEPSEPVAHAWFHRGMVNLDDEAALRALDDGKGTSIALYAAQPPQASGAPALQGQASIGNDKEFVSLLNGDKATKRSTIELADAHAARAVAAAPPAAATGGTADARDAVRYRWLRDGASNNRMPHVTQYPCQSFDNPRFPQIRDVGMDAAIDAAIKAMAPGEAG